MNADGSRGCRGRGEWGIGWRERVYPILDFREIRQGKGGRTDLKGDAEADFSPRRIRSIIKNRRKYKAPYT